MDGWKKKMDKFLDRNKYFNWVHWDQIAENITFFLNLLQFKDLKEPNIKEDGFKDKMSRKLMETVCTEHL